MEKTAENELISRLPGALLPWYETHRRDLPWRRDQDPYHIWVSEIMLQQTRVEAVKGYYARFLQQLPDIQALAQADDEVLNKLWEGLGYYSRVRNLKKAAITVMEQYGGEFPRDHDRVLSLPGIGAYTAGAICSIAFGQRTPAVDGNVLRVVSRITDNHTPIDLPARKKEVQQMLEESYPQEAGSFTQALMELGATLCGPNWKPRCEECPCSDFCLGRARATAEQLPVKLPKKSRRLEEKTVFILSCGDQYALEKRPETGLLAGLWQFPNCETLLSAEEAVDHIQQQGVHPRELLRQVRRKHIFTHVQWEMNGIYMEVDAPEGPYCWMTAEEIRTSAALPTAFKQFWEEIDHV